MIVGLVDADNYKKLGNCFPNLALMKLSAWHKQKGDLVEWHNPWKHYDRVYISKVFSFTPDYEFPINADEILGGGTGYCISIEDGKEVFIKDKHSNLPYEVEHIMPDYSLYGITDTAYGFMSRGCPRGCSFCIVKDKEGLCSTKVADLSEFWNGQKHIQLLDPNTLACKDWKDILTQLSDSNAIVDFNQGVDIRMMTTEKAEALKKVKTKSIHFAYDRYQDKQLIERKLNEFTEVFGTKFNRSHTRCYVLTNFDTTMDQNLDRVNFLRSLKIQPYIMIYEKYNLKRGDYLYKLSRWCNDSRLFWKYENIDDYIQNCGNYKKETKC